MLDVTLYATSDHGSKPEVLSQTAQASAPLTKLKQIRRGNGLYLLSKVKVMLSLFKYICLAVNHVDFVNSRVREKNQPLQLCTARTAWSDSVTKEEDRQKKSWKDNTIKDKEWTGMDCASITRAGENMSRWKMLF